MLRVSLLLLLLLLLCLFPGILFAQYWSDHFLFAGNSPFYTLDFDEDDDLDIIGLIGGVFIYENRLPDPWEQHSLDIPDWSSSDQDIIDFDADGDLDFAYYQAYHLEGPRIGWVESLGNHQYEVHVIAEFDDGSQHNTISAGDIEGDGDIDIVVTMAPDGSTQGFTTWTQQDDDSWIATQLSDLPHRGLSRLVDIDGDNLLDFAATSSWFDPDTMSGGIMVYFGTPEGSFEQHRLRWANAWACKEHQIVDFDDDGDLDIVTRHGYDWPYYYPCEIQWWENLGEREFVGHTIFSEWDQHESYSRPIAVLDVENDGDMDIATIFYVSFEEGRQYHILFNQGDNETFVIERISETVSA